MSDGPVDGMGRIQLHFLIGVFECDIISDLPVGDLFVEIGDPIALIALFNGRQQPCGQLIG